MTKTKLKITLSAFCILLFAFCIFCTLGAVSASAAAAADITVTIDTGASVTLKDTDNDGYYEIANADQLDAFSSLVNTNPSINGELTANIAYNTGDLSTLTGQTSGKREWKPFGWKLKTDGTKQHTTVGYSGNFNGNGYTISGLYFFYEMSYDAIGGLVASLNGGSVKNVTVTKSYFAGASYMGSIAGEMKGGSIENCHNIGSYVGAHRRVGGIVGNVSGGSITGCTNSGKVEFYMVNPDISATRECYGGIVGSIEYSSGVVSKCTNTGTISSADSSITCVGGIAGQSIDGATVDSCLNEGTVSAGASSSLHVGGIVGFTYNANVKNCLSLGSVTGYGTVGHVWGGTNTPKDYSNNYYNHTVTVTRADVQKLWDDGKAISATKDQLSSGEIAYLLGSNFGQNIDNGSTNQGHPVVGGATVRYGYKGCDATVKTYSNNSVQDTQGHNVIYSVSGNEITSTCTNLCNKAGTATLTAVKSQYTGTKQENATVSYSVDWLGGKLTPTYLNNVKAGTASASITIGGVSTSVEFEIEKGELEAQHFIISFLAGAADRYNGKDNSPYVTYESLSEITGYGEVTIRFFKDGIETPPIDAGYYVIKIDVTEGENYKATEELAVHFYEIQKAIPNPTRPTASEIIYGQPLSNSLLNGGWKWDVDTSLIPEVSNSGYTAYLIVNDDHNYDYTNLDGFDFDEDTKKLTTTVVLPVKKADASVASVPMANTNLTFNGTAHNLVSAGEAAGGEMQYSLEENGTYTSNIPTAIGAGTYTVYYKVIGDANHNNTRAASLTVKIEKAVPNCDIPTVLHATYGNKLSDVELTDGWSWNDNSLSVGTVGNNSFAATFRHEDSANYETVVKNLTVTVGKAAAPVIAFPSAEEIIYGELLGSAALTGGSTEFGTFAWKDSSILPTVINNGYTVVFTANANTLRNYEPVSVTEQRVSLTVGKRALTIIANDKSICIGSAYTLTYTVNGLLGSDTLTAEPTLSTDATLHTVGEYAITVSDATVSDNYEITYKNGTLTVRNHAYTGEMTTTPTCVAGGEMTYTCSHDSSHTYTKDVAIDENAHAWNEGAVTTNPTCSAVGTKTYTCTHNSEHIKTEDVAIDENAHAWNNGEVTTQPTCSAAGTKTYTCMHDSTHTKTEDVAIDANAHAWNEGLVMTEPSCSAVGTKTYTCMHDSTHTKTEDVAINENAHAWNNGEVTTQPTCSAAGTKTYTCMHDSTHTKTEDVAIDENDHAWNEGVITIATTCTEKGVKTFTCTHNSEHIKTEDMNALGHAYDNVCDTTCNTCGEERTPADHVDEDENNTCDICGSEIPKAGLSGGAVAGIVTGSAAAVGLGGFSLFWFVIKKKKWSDLIGIFKK